MSLGTSQVFNGFVFAFAPTPHGWVWIHGYPSAGDGGTCGIECGPTPGGVSVWTARTTPRNPLLERLFADLLDGHRLLQRTREGRRASWQTFRQVTNRTWCDGPIVLAGDAAHTTHFTIGSGTSSRCRTR